MLLGSSTLHEGEAASGLFGNTTTVANPFAGPPSQPTEAQVAIQLHLAIHLDDKDAFSRSLFENTSYKTSVFSAPPVQCRVSARVEVKSSEVPRAIQFLNAVICHSCAHNGLAFMPPSEAQCADPVGTVLLQSKGRRPRADPMCPILLPPPAPELPTRSGALAPARPPPTSTARPRAWAAAIAAAVAPFATRAHLELHSDPPAMRLWPASRSAWASILLLARAHGLEALEGSDIEGGLVWAVLSHTGPMPSWGTAQTEWVGFLARAIGHTPAVAQASGGGAIVAALAVADLLEGGVNLPDLPTGMAGHRATYHCAPAGGARTVGAGHHPPQPRAAARRQ